MSSCPGPLTCTYNCCDTQGQCPSSADLCSTYYPEVSASGYSDGFYVYYIVIPCVIFGVICIILIARNCYIRRQQQQAI